MMSNGILRRMAAFTTSPEGGNPAGVWVGDKLPDRETMRRIAADVGFSETAFIAPAAGTERTVRYYSPEAEVSFCGHATIASGAVLGTDNGRTEYRLSTAVGEVPVVVTERDGQTEVSLTSVETQFRQIPDGVLGEVLATLGWEYGDLDEEIPAMIAYAGAWHLVIGVANKDRLDELDYQFERLRTLMLDNDLTTLQLVWRASEKHFHARNPFPVGGIVEDPATGAAAAALGGYLRDAGILDVPATFEIYQGEGMGRPSLLKVAVPEAGGITVSGTAVELVKSDTGQKDE